MATTATTRQPTLAVGLLTASVALIDVALFARLAGDAHRGDVPWAALPVLVALLVAAEYLFVPFRHGNDVDTWNVMEAALAPALYAFAGPTVMVAVALAQVIGGTLRRNTPLKLSFNVAQWVLAAGLGSAAVRAIAADAPLPRTAAAVVVALVVVAAVNQVAMTVVLSIVRRESLIRVLRRRAADLVPGWIVGWPTNVLIGLLFVVAFDAHAAAVVLFPVPLVALHIAYRAAACARIDRQRQQGVHEAARLLAEPLDPTDAMRSFVDAVAAAFDARAVSFAIAGLDGAMVVHRTGEDGTGVGDLEAAVLEAGGCGRAAATDRTRIGDELAAAGWRGCVYAVSRGDSGAVVVAIGDQQGADGTDAHELALIEGLAREAMRTVEKGRLVKGVDDERRTLAAIISSTSDAIATIDGDGVVRSWNPAFERLTGIPAVDAVGSRDILVRLQARTLGGAPVEVERWASRARLPREIRITADDGEPRRLMCSYSRAVDDRTGIAVLVVVARDVTPAEEMEALRLHLRRIAEAGPDSRRSAGQWPHQLRPVPRDVPRTELAVDYVRPGAARGDAYDWYVLPTGDVHLAVVGLGSHDIRQIDRVVAALGRLRALADEGACFDELALALDGLFIGGRGAPRAVTIGRYEPDEGRLQLAGVGRPSTIVVTPHDGVHELDLAAGGAIDLRLALGESVVLASQPTMLHLSGEGGGDRALADRVDRMAHLPGRELVAHVLNGPIGAHAPADALVLAVRRVGTEPTRTWKVPPSVEAVGMFRREIVRWLRDRHVDKDDLEDVAVVVSELLTNAVRAARTNVEVHAVLERPTLELAVSDDGGGFEVGLDEVPDVDDLYAESGRGLHLVDALAVTWTVRAGHDGATVRAQLRVGDSGREVWLPSATHPAVLDSRDTAE